MSLQMSPRRAMVHSCLRPPQHPTTYVSALPSLPANLALPGTFSEQFLDTLRVTCGHDMIRPQAAQTVFRVHTSLVTSIVFSPDSTRIVTGSLDHTNQLLIHRQ
jgi:WD40 repeat protein